MSARQSLSHGQFIGIWELDIIWALVISPRFDFTYP